MSSKRSVVLARIKQSVGIGRHTQDNEVSEAVARLTAVSKAVSVLQAQVREMKAAFSTIGAVRSILMENILRTGGADDPGASETGARVRAVVASYKHLDGDLASALGAVFDSVVVGEVDAWAERVGALMEQVEQHNTNKLKYDHYAEKVEQLRAAQQARTAKGRMGGKEAAKLERNEDKLKQAKETFYSTRTTLLAALRDAWQERMAHAETLCLRLVQYDQKMLQEAQRGSTKLQPVMDAILADMHARQEGRPTQASAGHRPRGDTAGSASAVVAADAQFAPPSESEVGPDTRPIASPPPPQFADFSPDAGSGSSGAGSGPAIESKDATTSGANGTDAKANEQAIGAVHQQDTGKHSHGILGSVVSWARKRSGSSARGRVSLGGDGDDEKDSFSEDPREAKPPAPPRRLSIGGAPVTDNVQAAPQAANEDEPAPAGAPPAAAFTEVVKTPPALQLDPSNSSTPPRSRRGRRRTRSGGRGQGLGLPTASTRRRGSRRSVAVTQPSSSSSTSFVAAVATTSSEAGASAEKPGAVSAPKPWAPFTSAQPTTTTAAAAPTFSVDFSAAEGGNPPSSSSMAASSGATVPQDPFSMTFAAAAAPPSLPPAGATSAAAPPLSLFDAPAAPAFPPSNPNPSTATPTVVSAPVAAPATAAPASWDDFGGFDKKKEDDFDPFAALVSAPSGSAPSGSPPPPSTAAPVDDGNPVAPFNPFG